MATKSKLVQAINNPVQDSDTTIIMHTDLNAELRALNNAIMKKVGKLKNSEELAIPIVPVLTTIRNEIANNYKDVDKTTVEFFRKGDIQLLLNHFTLNYLHKLPDNGIEIQFTAGEQPTLYARKKAKRFFDFNVDKFYAKRKYDLGK
jgi:hypothetical protein